MGPVQQAIEKSFQQGVQQGIQLGVELKFGPEGLTLMPDILGIQDTNVLNTIHNGLKTVDSIEELQGIIYRKYPNNDGEER